MIASAGTTNTGAIDDLRGIETVCQREGLWYHIDGCIGALIAIAPGHGGLIYGIAAVDSLALDRHKWLHATFEAGCALVRDRDLHFGTFNLRGEYLQEQPRGLAAAEFLGEYGFDLSRGFKALKIWMALKEQGAAKLGRLIDQNIAQASYLAALVAAEAELEIMVPVPINIVCFRYRGAGGTEAALRDLNVAVMLRIQEGGLEVMSDTTVQGRHCLRVAITNHRTRCEDLALLAREAIRVGREVASGG